ncbi:CBS domain-containing protein [Candidatus Saccharibacteria bacterium]|nr:CBS domain-containing protein [Candidatus Saccharibacteria bacterium]
MAENIEHFIELYKELEAAVRITYKIDKKDSVAHYLTQQDKFSKYKEDILLCSDTRNLIQHGRTVNNDFIVQPTDQMIKFITSLISKVKNRQKCSDIMIKIGDVYRGSMQGSVSESIDIMKEKAYTHVPILENRKVIGVFDENSLFCFVSDGNSVSDSLTFESIKKYLGLNNRECEGFLFAKKNEYVDEIEESMNAAFKKQKRIGMVFVTDTGDEDGKLLGILTPWDIIASYKEI